MSTAIEKLVALNQSGAEKSATEAVEIKRTATFETIALACITVVLALGAGLAMKTGIGSPLLAITDAMRQLAAGNKTIEIPAHGRKDEVGAMAEAVEVFKQNVIEAERLSAAQEAARAERERRAAKIEALTQAFDQQVSNVLEIVSSACTEMDATAQTLSASAEQTSRQSGIVAAATEEASASVQTVASAAEQLSTSVTEIGR